MMNYIKSEFYRMFHGKELYIYSFGMAGLTVIMNIVLALFGTNPHFPYASVKYSLNLLTFSIMFVCGAACFVTTALFGDEHKNGTIKNVTSFGISRTVLFTGKCIVCSVMCFISMIIVLVFYIGSAYLFLQNKETEPLQEMMKGIGAVLLWAFASVILTVLLCWLIKKESVMVMVWLAVMMFIPMVCQMLGLKIELLGKAAGWMPYNFLRFRDTVNAAEYNFIWNSPGGLGKCLLSGAAGIIIFYVAGVLALRHKDID